MDTLAHGTEIESLREFLQVHPHYNVYDHSQISLWSQCPRKYSYRYIDKVVTKYDASAAFSSHVIHPALAYWFEVKDTGVFTDTIQPLLATWWAKFVNEGIPTSSPLSAKQLQIYTPKVALSVLESISETLGEITKAYAFKSAETVYWSELPNVKDTIWLAKPDVVLVNKETGKLVTVEFKTSMWNFTKDLNPFDRQILSQAWVVGAESQFKVFVEFQFTSKRVYDKFVIHTSGPTAPDAQLLTEWLAEVEFEVDSIQKARQSGVFVKRAPTSCQDFNTRCKFYELCTAGSAGKYLATNMEHDNPLEYLGL